MVRIKKTLTKPLTWFTVSDRTQETSWNDLNDQVNMLYQQGQYSEAAKVAEEALKVTEKTFGPDHPKVATSLSILALLHHSQGKYAEAEPICERTLVIREKALEPDHPKVATSLSNLALLYHSQGRYAEAEPLYKRALAIREKALEPEHPDVGQSLNRSAVARAWSWSRGGGSFPQPPGG